LTIVLNSKGFKLPRLEKEKFINLIRLGLDYDRNAALFSVKSYNSIKSAIDAISDILGEEVVFLQNCVQCNTSFPCKSCNYIELCTTKNLPFSCVCPKCLRSKKDFAESLDNC
jgi:hypothetical protein